MMISVTTHYESGEEINNSMFDSLKTAQSYIKAMWSNAWADHFIVTGPDWKVIVRRWPKKIVELNKFDRNWRKQTYPNGAKMYASDGTMLDERGNRSIFDDVDE